MLATPTRPLTLARLVGMPVEPATPNYALEFVTLTPALARHILTANVSNRPKSSPTIRTYTTAMSEGRWSARADPGIAIALFPDGTSRLMNGQHRLEAVIASGRTQYGIQVRLFATTPEEAEEDYANYDQGKNRTTTDVIGIDTEVRNRKSLGVAITAMALVEVLVPLGFTEWKLMNVARRAKLYHKHSAEIIRAARLRDSASFAGRRMGAGFLAAVIETHRVAATEAEAFWERVGTGEGLAQGDPTFALREVILRHGSTGTVSHVGLLRHRALALLAWRHQCHGTRVTLLKAPSEDAAALRAVAVTAPKRASLDGAALWGAR